MESTFLSLFCYSSNLAACFIPLNIEPIFSAIFYCTSFASGDKGCNLLAEGLRLTWGVAKSLGSVDRGFNLLAEGLRLLLVADPVSSSKKSFLNA